MGRIIRVVNYTATLANTWYKIFDESDYQKNRIKEIKLKMRETATADHFRYNFDGATTPYMTSSTGFITLTDVKKLYVYVPDEASQVFEIEIVYK